MSSDAALPESLNNVPTSDSFWVEFYRDQCVKSAANAVRLEGEIAFMNRRHQKELDRLKGESDRLKGAYDELKGSHDELQGKHDALTEENASLRRQLELRSETGQARTPSRARTSEGGIGLRTPPPSSKGTSPPLIARQAGATDASGSPHGAEGESSSEDENLADFARRIRAGRMRVGPVQREEQRNRPQRTQPDRARQERRRLSGLHPIRWGPKHGAREDKGKQTRKRDAPEEGSGSDVPLARRPNMVNRRSSSSSKRMRLEGVFPPPLPRRYTSVSSPPEPAPESKMTQADSEGEEDDDEMEEEKDDDEGEDDGNKDDLFSLTSLTPVSSRPSTPMPVDPVGPVVPQEPATPQGPPLPEGAREPQASVPVVQHFRSPSRELSYFDPIPQPHLPAMSPADAPQSTIRESQVETPQTVLGSHLPTGPTTVPSGSDVSSLARKDSWSFTDRAMASLAADPPNLHPFSVSAHSQRFPLSNFSFPPTQPSTSDPASSSRPSPLPPPPPEASVTSQSLRPLEIARNLLRQTVPTSSASRLPVPLPATAPSRTTTLEVPSPATIPPRVPSAPPPSVVTVLMPPPSSSTTAGPSTEMTASQKVAPPLPTPSTSQPEGRAYRPPASAPHPTAPRPSAPPLSTAPPSATPLPMTAPVSAPAPAPTAIPPSPTVHPCMQAAALNHESQTSNVPLPGTTPPTPTGAGPSQPSRVCLGHRTTTQLRPGVVTRLGPPLLHEDALNARLTQVVYSTDGVNPDLLNMAFSRDFISQTFGGHSKRKCTVCRDGRALIFGNPTFDSHLPLCPGVSGLLFHASCGPDWKPGPNSLFIETQTAQHWYIGNYKLEETTALTMEEYAAWPIEIKRKWAGDIMNKKKHRDVRVGIVLRRRLGREPDEVELSNAVSDGDDYKDVSRDEIIQAYEQGHQTMSVFTLTCVGYDDGFMKEAAERLPAYLRRRAEPQAVQEPRAPVGEAARSA